MVLCKHRQYIRRVKAVEIVCKHRALAQPLPVKFAPERLAPAGFRNGEVQPVFIYAVPVFRRDIVTERVFIVMRRNFRVARCAGCEEHKH